MVLFRGREVLSRRYRRVSFCVGCDLRRCSASCGTIALHMPTHQQHLIAVALADLHPTQITVGAAEVAVKREQWAGLKRKARKHTLAAHWFPAVKGPEGRYYIVDHHHLGMALHQEDVGTVWVMQLDDLSAIRGEAFWRLMEFHRWAHPYDAKGRRQGYEAIPSQISKLHDDPYRSLAGFVRSAGGYAKDAAPFAEFLWADFFRPLIPRRALEKSRTQALPVEALQQAVALARGPGARYLPGWTGVSPSLSAVSSGLGGGAPAAVLAE